MAGSHQETMTTNLVGGVGVEKLFLRRIPETNKDFPCLTHSSVVKPISADIVRRVIGYLREDRG